jgi:general secretion pathway protein C
MAIDRLFRRHFWVVLLVLLSSAAYFDADGIMHVVEAAIGADAKQLAMRTLMVRVPLAPASASPHAVSAAAILSRNPFDSVTGPFRLDAEQPSERPEETDPFKVPECEGVRVSIIAAFDESAWSFAALGAQAAGGKSFLRRRGGELAAKRVAFIGSDRVWLSSGPQLCQSRMFQPPSAAPAPTPVSAAPAAPVGLDPAIATGIRQKSATEFEVDRGVVDRILEHQAELMSIARVTPDAAGIRVSGVRADSLLGALGIQNGDRLEKINGFDLTNVEKSLEAYARLRTANHLTVSLTRNGRETNLDYDIK